MSSPSSTTENKDTNTTPEEAKTADPTPYKIVLTRVTPSPEPEQQPQVASTSTAVAAEGTPWQAIFSPQHGTYYFYNSATGETTWTNPIVPSEPATQPTPAPETDETSKGKEKETEIEAYEPPHVAMYNAALAAGIDPALAHLDPTLAHSLPPTAASASSLPSFKATFNARTGRFTSSSLDENPSAAALRTPDHMSEYERAKRMSSVYFDVNAWEGEVAERDRKAKEEGGDKKRKRPSKSDLERFKESKKAKKIAKTAWLRN